MKEFFVGRRTKDIERHLPA